MFLAEPQRTAYDLNFSLGGVPVRVHPMFWLFTVLLGANDPVPLHLLIWVVAVFLSILVHEFGHSLAMRSFGWTSHIVLYSFGGLAVQDGSHGGFERPGRRGRDARTQIIISFAGPLAGLHAALAQATSPLLVTVPCDSPFLPADLVARLRAALEAENADLAVARTGDRVHRAFCLARRELLPQLDAFLATGERKVGLWHASLKVAEVAFDDEPDAFSNINTPEELRALQNQDRRH